MLLLGISSALAGMVLGQRFKVLVLVPAIALALIATIAFGLARAEASWMTGLAAAIVIASLQTGYLLGLGIRHLTVIARASRLRAAHFANAVPARRSAAH